MESCWYFGRTIDPLVVWYMPSRRLGWTLVLGVSLVIGSWDVSSNLGWTLVLGVLLVIGSWDVSRNLGRTIGCFILSVVTGVPWLDRSMTPSSNDCWSLGWKIRSSLGLCGTLIVVYIGCYVVSLDATIVSWFLWVHRLVTLMVPWFIGQ